MPPVNASKYLVTAGWQDAPHLDDQVKAELLASTPRHLRDARTKGRPSLGSGAIYPFEPEEINCAPFAIPAHFKRGYGMDVGWERTAAIFGAWDVDNDVLYLVSEHYRSHAEPSVHADAIKARGDWQTGVCDYSGTNPHNGERTIELYQGLDLKLVKADKAVEAGLLLVEQRLAQGRLKVFTTCQNWFSEQMIYRRDEKGKIIKAHDHLMDCTRYLVMRMVEVMRCKPVPRRGTPTFQIADTVGGY